MSFYLLQNEVRKVGSVQRMEDGRKFELCLSELEATDRLSKNYQLLDDYSCWFVNYQ